MGDVAAGVPERQFVLCERPPVWRGVERKNPLTDLAHPGLGNYVVWKWTAYEGARASHTRRGVGPWFAQVRGVRIVDLDSISAEAASRTNVQRRGIVKNWIIPHFPKTPLTSEIENFFFSVLPPLPTSH